MSSARRGHRPRSILAVLTLTGLLLASGAAVTTASAAAAAPPSKLGKQDRQRLAKAKADGAKTVTVLVSAKDGQAGNAVTGLTKAGATIRYRDDALGYVRARIATSKVESASRLAAVKFLNINDAVEIGDPKVSKPGDHGDTVPVPAPGATTPDSNPYMPTRDIGAAQFKAANPTFDGRGTTIGILDTGVDQDHPSLRVTSTGAEKLLDWVAVSDPVDDGDPTWVNMDTPTSKVSGPTFQWGTVPANTFTYTAPAGAWRFGRVHEGNFNSAEMSGDVNRDGLSQDRIGVLWRLSDNGVLVDTDFDKDFTDEVLMRDYRVSRQVGHFGVDNPATAIRESVPFTVQTDTKNKFVNIGVTTGAHGSHVAGIAAGNALFGGAMDGAAPGAQIVSVRVCRFVGGCSNSAMIEGMIYALKTAKVDVVNMSVGGLPALNDGDNVRADIYNKLIDQTGGQMFISAGNSGAGVNTVGDPSVASRVVSVGAAVTRSTWLHNYGAVTTSAPDLRLFGFSSRGPREDGGIKPDIIASGSAVSTIPLWEADGAVPETGYELPPGYAMFNGTSMSSPQAAGAGALLVGAAKVTRVGHDAAQLRQAIYSSASYQPALPAYGQGRGLVNVPAAWTLLKSGVATTAISTTAPVCSTVWQVLGLTTGTGIHNHCAVGEGGQSSGSTRTYPVTISKSSTAKKTLNLSWLGNDGTFSAPSSVSLGGSKVVNVTAIPVGAGAHSAILKIDDPTTKGVDHHMMAFVSVSNALAAPSYSQTFSGSVERTRTQQFFVTVPEGAPYMKVDLSGFTAGSQVRWIAVHPYGIPFEDNSSLSCYTNRPLNDCNPTLRTYTAPQPGVWEFTVESRRTTPTLDNPFTLSAQILGVDVDPASTTYESLPAGVPQAKAYTFTNEWAPVTAAAEGTAFQSAKIDRPTIGHLAQQSFTVVVPAGSSSLRVAISNPSDLAADLDLFLDGPDGTSLFDADGDSDEKIMVENPAAGEWHVTVDGFDVPAGTTAYDYIDAFAAPGLGGISLTDAQALRPNGAVWGAPATITAATAPAAGRSLFGQVVVKTTDGVTIGAGDVKVLAVT